MHIAYLNRSGIHLTRSANRLLLSFDSLGCSTGIVCYMLSSTNLAAASNLHLPVATHLELHGPAAKQREPNLPAAKHPQPLILEAKHLQLQ